MSFLKSPSPIDYLLVIPMYFLAYIIMNCIVKPVVGAKFTDRYMGTGPGGVFHEDTLKRAAKQMAIALVVIVLLIWLFLEWASHN